MSRFNKIFARSAAVPLVLVASLAAGSATAQTQYPRAIINGENSEIDYGPMGNANAAVGGGRVVAMGAGENTELRHLDDNFIQPGREGLKPLTVGSGEGATIVWVPQRLPRSLHALVGADGSWPAQGQASSFASASAARYR